MLVAKDVHKTYFLGETTVHALGGVSLSVEPAEFLALAGASGSGKTTLLNLFGCLDVPSSGLFFFQGTGIQKLTEEERDHFRATKIGFIFQTFNLLPVLTAQENVEYPLLILNCSKKERQERARESLVRVGLEKCLGQRPNQLSGGQRQRVAIARAMVKRPSIVLADEPTANLDKKTATEVLDLMQDLNVREGVTFVFSSHDPLVLSRASRIFYLSDGVEVKENQYHQRVALERAV
jgi:putative ABC transport system ATP-binding protein